MTVHQLSAITVTIQLLYTYYTVKNVIALRLSVITIQFIYDTSCMHGYHSVLTSFCIARSFYLINKKQWMHVTIL